MRIAGAALNILEKPPFETLPLRIVTLGLRGALSARELLIESVERVGQVDVVLGVGAHVHHELAQDLPA